MRFSHEQATATTPPEDAKGSPGTHHRNSAARSDAAGSAMSIPQPRLLVIEDSDEDFVAMVRAFRQAGWDRVPERCATGDEALDYLYRRGAIAANAPVPAPQLILLDLNLPGTDGRTLLATIKADIQLQTIPVIVLTTSDNPRDIDDCYRYGANSYQVKPVDYPRFKQALRNLIAYWLETAMLPKPQEEHHG
jgi:CheY-like chemotaxis protein